MPLLSFPRVIPTTSVAGFIPARRMQVDSASRRRYTADEWEGLLSGLDRGDQQSADAAEFRMQDDIMEYFLSEGFSEVAAAFKAEALSGRADAGADAAASAELDARNESATAIRASIQAGDTDGNGALSTISRVCPELIASSDACIRHLKQQNVAELVWSGNLELAVRTIEHDSVPL